MERPAEMNDKIKSLTEPFENPNKTWYEANCHCGAVKFKVRIPSLANVEVNCCDCFICSRNGYLLVYPSKEDVVFHTGYDHLKSYGFGNKNAAHIFCPNDGSSLFADLGSVGGKDVLAVNVRMFKDIEVEGLKIKYCNGKNL